MDYIEKGVGDNLEMILKKNSGGSVILLAGFPKFNTQSRASNIHIYLGSVDDLAGTFASCTP